MNARRQQEERDRALAMEINNHPTPIIHKSPNLRTYHSNNESNTNLVKDIILNGNSNNNNPADNNYNNHHPHNNPNLNPSNSNSNSNSNNNNISYIKKSNRRSRSIHSKIGGVITKTDHLLHHPSHIFQHSSSACPNTTLRKQIKTSRKEFKTKLKEHKLEEYPIEADGNCQFGAISDQLFGTEDLHWKVIYIYIPSFMKDNIFYWINNFCFI